jgi:hypothetical protein
MTQHTQDLGQLTRRKCTAHSSQTGAPCKAWAIQGGTVCATHGGRAPQVKRKAEERLQALVDPAIVALQEIVSDAKHPQRMAAVKEILERDGRIGAAKSKGNESRLAQREDFELWFKAQKVPEGEPEEGDNT